MNKLFIFIITLCSLHGFTQTKYKLCYDGQVLAYPQGTEEKSNLIYNLNRGDSVFILDYNSEYWYVKFNNIKGFVYEENFCSDKKLDKIKDSLIKTPNKKYNDSINNIKYKQKFFHKKDSIFKIKNHPQFVIDSLQHVKDSIENAENLKKEYLKYSPYKKLGIPLFFEKVSLSDNSIGVPEVDLIVKNISKKTIDAYTVKIYCYNNFNDPVYYLGTNIFSGISQSPIEKGNINGISIGGEICCGNVWTLYGFDNATKVIVYLVKVHYTDNTTWYNPNLNSMSIKNF